MLFQANVWKIIWKNVNEMKHVMRLYTLLSLIMEINDLWLTICPQVVHECNCFTIDYFDVAKLKAEKVKVGAGYYDNVPL